MSISVERIRLSFFVWYILPGLNFLVVDVLVPLVVLSPGTVLLLGADFGHFVLLGVSALVVGFVMDSLKLYQFTWGYAKKKAEFLDKLGSILDVGQPEAERVFPAIRGLARQDPYV